MTFPQLTSFIHSTVQKAKALYPELERWSVQFNSRLTSCMGRACDPVGTPYVEFSTQLFILNLSTPNFKEIVIDIVLHEFAHALDWERNNNWGHSESWKKICEELGCKPERCYDSEQFTAIPRGFNFAIRDPETGRCFDYYRNKPNILQIQKAKKWAYVENNKDLREDLEIVTLATGLTVKIL